MKSGVGDEYTHLLEIKVRCPDWKNIQDPRTILEVSIEKRESLRRMDRRQETPKWCEQSMGWAYALGRMLRSAITGEPDFTARGFAFREEYGRYRGLRSSWFKRRLGMLHSAGGLHEEPLPVSPWLSEFIMRLLQWPGLEIHGELVIGFESVKSPEELEPAIVARLEHQKKLYGVRSRLPIYILPADVIETSSRRGFRIAIVQTLLPRVDDFDAKNPCWWSPKYRRKHRAHTAAICRLVSQHLEAHSTARDVGGDSTPDYLDLIVFPELAVHPEDVFLLSRLSDVTQASIYAGLTFQPIGPGGKPVNQALWLLRQRTGRGRTITPLMQGKEHMTEAEKKMGVVGHRPYQAVIEFDAGRDKRYRFSGTICYDATDLSLAADLRDISDAFVVAALNRDISTFDNMVSALNYHMYQPVVLANTGEFGGSTAQAPYRQRYDQLIAHVHGVEQVAVSVFELNLDDFKTVKKAAKNKEKKGPPAAYTGRE
jgi:hypothetical protein